MGSDTNALSSTRVDQMSYSRVKLFNECSYAWFLRYMCGYNERPMFYSTFGRLAHELIEKYYTGEISKEQLPVEYIKGFFEKVSHYGAPDSVIENYQQQGFEYFKNFKEFPYEPVAVEKKIDFEIEGHAFTSIVDFVGKDDDGLCIIDHKSRDIKPRGKRKKPLATDKVLDKMLEQLYLYSSAVKTEYGEYPKKLCFNCYRTGVFIEEPFVKETYDKVIEKLLKATKDIEDENEWLPNIDWFYCSSICGMCDICEYRDSLRSSGRNKR